MDSIEKICFWKPWTSPPKPLWRFRALVQRNTFWVLLRHFGEKKKHQNLRLTDKSFQDLPGPLDGVEFPHPQHGVTFPRQKRLEALWHFTSRPPKKNEPKSFRRFLMKFQVFIFKGQLQQHQLTSFHVVGFNTASPVVCWWFVQPLWKSTCNLARTETNTWRSWSLKQKQLVWTCCEVFRRPESEWSGISSGKIQNSSASCNESNEDIPKSHWEVYTDIHAYTHACMHTYIHSFIHTSIHA